MVLKQTLVLLKFGEVIARAGAGQGGALVGVGNEGIWMSGRPRNGPMSSKTEGSMRQMSKNITIIPPSESRPNILRVATYCRVSTDLDEQASSYASQIRSYTELISQHEGWELVDIYADEAVSGTKTEKREDFNRLLADCRKGRIDRVLVKSISRFSRNTKDCLTALRDLMRLGVTVQFEKENIDTGTLTTELMVSVSGSLAQQESMSISQNIHQSYRRRMERGEFITTKPPYGYRLVNRRELEIVPEEAEIIRWVFDAYLGGQSARDIANELIRRGVRDRKGNVHWTTREIYYWLSNEKYVGDTLCQKTYKTGFPFVQKINQGEVDQFYVEGTHPAIVSQEVYDKAQALRQMKKKKINGPDGIYPLSRKMCCGICGFTLYRHVTRKGSVTWSCGRHQRKASNCRTGHIPEDAIYAAFLQVYNKLRLHQGIILRPALNQMEALETAVQRDNPAMLEVNRAIAQATERGYRISKLRANGLLDADACSAQMAVNNAQLTQLRAKRRRLLKNDDIGETAEALRQTVDVIRQGPEQLEMFDEALFAELVEQIVVSPTELRFRLYGGIEVEERIREDKR